MLILEKVVDGIIDGESFFGFHVNATAPVKSFEYDLDGSNITNDTLWNVFESALNRPLKNEMVEGEFEKYQVDYDGEFAYLTFNKFDDDFMPVLSLPSYRVKLSEMEYVRFDDVFININK